MMSQWVLIQSLQVCLLPLNESQAAVVIKYIFDFECCLTNLQFIKTEIS